MAIRQKPLIAITMGDAAGIGPEVIARALAAVHIHRLCRPLVIGSAAIMQEAVRLTGAPVELHAITAVTEASGKPGVIDVLDLDNLKPSEVSVGHVCAACGRASVEYITKAASLALEGKIAAVVTAPINKEATRLAGCGDIGHLELLARLTKTTSYATMLVAGRLRTVHLTTHHSLREACNLVTRERVLARLRLAYDSFRGWGVDRPRLGVAALNPHAGEGGLFGNEEIEQITPAVEEARRMGIDARGPFPADSIFNRALAGEFDAVLAMYHDQGHIPVKVHNFEKSVSVALGLPFVRTSVDHGTAFDIAGKGIASPVSMVEALKVAARLSAGKGL